MLDYSIRGLITPSISHEFYGWTDRGGSSSMVLEPRFWVQFPPVTQYSAAYISPSLAYTGPAGTTAPEREHVAPTTAAHTQEGKRWIIA
jgi:hypothetical protein